MGTKDGSVAENDATGHVTSPGQSLWVESDSGECKELAPKSEDASIGKSQASFGVDVLVAAIAQARKAGGNPYQKRSLVLYSLKILELEYRRARSYVYALWCRQMTKRIINVGSVQAVVDEYRAVVGLPLASNTGVNLLGSSNYAK